MYTAIDSEEIKRNFIYKDEISYGSIMEKALLETFELMVQNSTDWEGLADKIEVLEYFLREYGYIDQQVTKVHEDLINKKIKK